MTSASIGDLLVSAGRRFSQIGYGEFCGRLERAALFIPFIAPYEARRRKSLSWSRRSYSDFVLFCVGKRILSLTSRLVIFARRTRVFGLPNDDMGEIVDYVYSAATNRRRVLLETRQ